MASSREPTWDRMPCGFVFASGNGCWAAESHAIHHGGWYQKKGPEPDHEYIPFDRRTRERRAALPPAAPDRLREALDAAVAHAVGPCSPGRSPGPGGGTAGMSDYLQLTGLVIVASVVNVASGHSPLVLGAATSIAWSLGRWQMHRRMAALIRESVVSIRSVLR